MQNSLEIFIERGCDNCLEASSIADRLRVQAPAVHVSLIDLEREPHRRPDNVFAVPTYILNGEILSLGNPRYDDLLAALKQKSDRSTNEVVEHGKYQDPGVD
jgi:alkyl hydroperoxide reductase subunit AhpF